MTSTAEILKAARKLIEKPENWTKGAFARSAKGSRVRPVYKGAVCFCSIGALQKVSVGGNYTDAINFLRREVPEDCMGVMAFNDSRTHSEVLDLFSKAIAAAEASS